MRLQELALWARRFTPLVAIEKEALEHYARGELEKMSPLYNGIVLDITGTERLHNSEERLAQRIASALHKGGMAAKAAVAPSIGAAWALSRFARSAVIILPQGPLREALHHLPVAALRVSGGAAHVLAELGIITIADLRKLPRKGLPPRFGKEILLRLDQAYGAVDEALEMVTAQRPFAAARSFAVPLQDSAHVTRSVIALLQKVLKELSSCCLKARAFSVVLEEKGANPRLNTKEISLNAASNSFAHLAAIVSALFESVKAKDGISAIRVVAHDIAGAASEQINFVNGECEKIAPRAREELFNHFVTRLGQENVRKLKLLESYIPEKAFTYVKLDLNHEACCTDNIEALLLPADRPSCILPVPEQITCIALLPDRAPSWMRWRGKAYHIVKSAEPISGLERIAHEWWNTGINSGEALRARDYFRVQDATGRWLWIFRDSATQKWFVHGIWA